MSVKSTVFLEEPFGFSETGLLGRFVNRYLRWGISGYPRVERRRLALTNLTGFLIAVCCLIYAICFALFDIRNLAWAVWVNLLCCLLFLLTPLWHRFGLLGSAAYLSILGYLTLFWFSRQFGVASGTHLNFLTAIAISAVVFGNRWSWLLTNIVLGWALHLFAHTYFQTGQVDSLQFDWLLRILYLNAVTTFVIVVSCVVCYAFRIAAEAEEQTDSLLKNILPEQIATRLKQDPNQPIADRFAEASVLFADLADFTIILGQLEPEKMVRLLDEIFSRFDDLSELHRAEKIKTIGDAYMVVSGAPTPNETHAADLIRLAKAMLASLAEIESRHHLGLQIRIGIATGPITAGVIGRAKFAYDVWAPTVNLAARLQTSGEVGRIHVADETRRGVGTAFSFEPAETKELKGIGLRRTWFVKS